MHSRAHILWEHTRIYTLIHKYVRTYFFVYLFTQGNLDIVRLLVLKGANINAASHSGNTGLLVSSMHGFLDIVSISCLSACVYVLNTLSQSLHGVWNWPLFILHKNNVDVLDWLHSWQDPIYTLYILNVNVTQVRLLVDKKASLHDLTTFGNSALLLASNKGFTSTALQLIKAG